MLQNEPGYRRMKRVKSVGFYQAVTVLASTSSSWSLNQVTLGVSFVSCWSWSGDYLPASSSLNLSVTRVRLSHIVQSMRFSVKFNWVTKYILFSCFMEFTKWKLFLGDLSFTYLKLKKGVVYKKQEYIVKYLCFLSPKTI